MTEHVCGLPRQCGPGGLRSAVAVAANFNWKSHSVLFFFFFLFFFFLLEIGEKGIPFHLEPWFSMRFILAPVVCSVAIVVIILFYFIFFGR